MPKRKSLDKINYYKEKIKKLEEKCNRRNKRRIIIQSDSSDDNSDVEVPVATENILPHSESPEVQTEVSDLRTNTILDLPTSDGELHGESANLTPEYLQALGDAINEVPQYGEDIHHDLALRWLPILRRGLPKDVREKLVTSYSIPSNYLHYQDSDTRIKLLSPSLDKSILNIIDNNERDETLFGNNLSEKIKAAKTIEKQGKLVGPSPVPIEQGGAHRITDASFDDGNDTSNAPYGHSTATTTQPLEQATHSSAAPTSIEVRADSDGRALRGALSAPAPT
ncbi:uncharacterized protein LOC124530930 [Vanessa cardui]|uniref:uncharacterized protein LOC124530930 n=1 Tax=Vanessa cardui TaxID=171605 RepID=UPI001F133B9E|nr:uncharacterized protein LOC124530930 [Vanessa cardui]